MAAAEGFVSGSVGSLSYKPAPGESLVPLTVDFVLAQLPAWRDDATRAADTNENQMNSSLCDFLDTQSRAHFPMVRFKHQAPQTTSHTVDMAAHGLEQITTVDTRCYTIYQPFLVIEAKRLPAPSKDREQEYIQGTDKPSGAIERFKLGLHGAGVETAVIVGYIEDHTPAHWHEAVNNWIANAISKLATQRCTWTYEDKLGDLVVDEERGTAISASNHVRAATCSTSSIRIRHLWIVMYR